MNIYNRELAKFIETLGGRTPWLSCDFNSQWMVTGSSLDVTPLNLITVSIPSTGFDFRNAEELGGKVIPEFLPNGPIQVQFLAKDIDIFEAIYKRQLSKYGTLRVGFNKDSILEIVVNTPFGRSALLGEQDKLKYTFYKVAMKRPAIGQLTQHSIDLLYYTTAFSYEDYKFEIVGR